jgi:hypothetical protein
MDGRREFFHDGWTRDCRPDQAEDEAARANPGAVWWRLYIVHGKGDTALARGTASAANRIPDNFDCGEENGTDTVVMPFNGGNASAPAVWSWQWWRGRRRG